MSITEINPVVSVIMPVYNGHKYLREAVLSILEQSLEAFELIVLDDGSTDDTSKILGSFEDVRIRVLTNEKNLGVARSLNRGIRASRGSYIARIDSDDIALKDRLKIQIDYLERHPEVSLVGGKIECFGQSTAVIGYWNDHDRIHANCLFNTPFAHPVVCWRKKDFEKNGLFYQEDPPTAEDFELWERSCHLVQCRNLNCTLIRYRIDPYIKISNYLKQQYSGARKVRERLLKASGIVLSEDLLNTLHWVGEGGLEVSVESLRKADVLFREIIKQNQISQYFDDKVVSDVLRKWWYDLLLRHRNVISTIEYLKMCCSILQYRWGLSLEQNSF